MAFILAKNAADYCNNAVCAECTNASGKQTDCGVRVLVCWAVDELAFSGKMAPLSLQLPTQDHQSSIFISDRATAVTFLPGKLHRSLFVVQQLPKFSCGRRRPPQIVFRQLSKHNLWSRRSKLDCTGCWDVENLWPLLWPKVFSSCVWPDAWYSNLQGEDTLTEFGVFLQTLRRSEKLVGGKVSRLSGLHQKPCWLQDLVCWNLEVSPVLQDAARPPSDKFT